MPWLADLTAAILQRVLGRYVTGLDGRSLKLAVWSGRVVLERDGRELRRAAVQCAERGLVHFDRGRARQLARKREACRAEHEAARGRDRQARSAARAHGRVNDGEV